MYGLLKGKKALITGGAQGIGFAVAQIYAENGADILIADLDKQKAALAASGIADKTGVKAVSCAADIANKQSVSDMVRHAVEQLGCIDILCHSAGILIHASILEMDEKEWDTIFAVNAKGTFLVNQAVAAHMISNGGGKIVNFSSCSGKKPTPEEAAYCATKGAVNAFTKVAALELGRHNICVNAICPGATDTPMVRKTFITSPEIEAEWIEKTALKRLGQPIDQARVALFLASELANHITGEAIVVSAGEMMSQ